MKITEIRGNEKVRGVTRTISGTLGEWMRANNVINIEDLRTVSDKIDLTKEGIISLEGCPEKIFSSLWLGSNYLSTMKYGPREIIGNLILEMNDLNSFEHFPQKIFGALNISMNKFTSLQDIHKHIKIIKGPILVAGDNLKSHFLGVFLIESLTYITPGSSNPTVNEAIVIVNRHLRPTENTSSEVRREAMYACQDELTENGLEEFAQL